MSRDSGPNMDLPARWREAAERAGRGDPTDLALLFNDSDVPLAAAERVRVSIGRLLRDMALTTDAAKRRREVDYERLRRRGRTSADAFREGAMLWGITVRKFKNSVRRADREPKRRG